MFAFVVCLLSKIADSDDISRVFQSKITHETYRDIKSAYILTKKDQAFKHDYQLRTVHNAGISVTKTMDTGHSPFLSKPEEVTEFILSFADKLAI